MARILIHVTTGPDDPTKAALAFLVAKTALGEGHDVSLFLAGEAVRLLSPAVLESVEGVGTGNLSEHHAEIVQGGAAVYFSGMSAKARGFAPEQLGHSGAQPGMPDVLVRLLLESDRNLTY